MKVSHDAGDDEPLKNHIDVKDWEPGESGEELLVGDGVEGVDGPAGPFVVVEVFMVDVESSAVWEEVEEPEYEERNPEEPKRVALSEMGLKLN